MNRHIFFAVAVCCIIAGCATSPVPSSQATQVPKDRLYAYQSPSDKANSTIVVTRDSGLLGGGCFVGFWVDDILAGRFDTGETSAFYIEPGERVLRVGRDLQGKGLCTVEIDNWTVRETFLKKDGRKHFRLSMDTAGKFDVQRSD